jgi:hypothetical protein
MGVRGIASGAALGANPDGAAGGGIRGQGRGGQTVTGDAVGGRKERCDLHDLQ